MSSDTCTGPARPWALALSLMAFGMTMGAALLARREARRSRSPRRPAPASGLNMVDETLDESFPASDPPSWSPVVGLR